MSPETLVAAILTFCIFSFLYKENPFYRFAEHLLLGISVGYFVVIAFNTTVIPKFITPLFKEGRLLFILPGILGLLMFSRFSTRWSWLSRISLAVIIGAGAGVAIPATLSAQIFSQMKASMLILDFSSLGSLVSNLIILAAICSVLLYFFFSKEQKGWFGGVTKVGIYFLMIFFGATFGYTVMSRISLLIGRVQFLLGDFLRLIQ